MEVVFYFTIDGIRDLETPPDGVLVSGSARRSKLEKLRARKASEKYFSLVLVIYFTLPFFSGHIS